MKSKYIVMDFYTLRKPKVNDIVVVPLVHPGGAYIRLENNAIIPILAKIRHVFGESVNVINYFGYIYNVPFSHANQISPSVSDQFYTDMIKNAAKYMDKLGYQMLDNKEFYQLGTKYTKYTFIPALPGKDKLFYVVSDESDHSPLYVEMKDNVTFSPVAPLSFNDNSSIHITTSTPSNYPHPKNLKQAAPSFTSHHDQNKRFGEIRVIVFNNSEVLHFVKSSSRSIIFDNKKGEIQIKRYGSFIINESYEYRDSKNTKFIIFRSGKNYFHVPMSNLTYAKVTDDEPNGYYNVKNIKYKGGEMKKNPVLNTYYHVIKLINSIFQE